MFTKTVLARACFQFFFCAQNLLVLATTAFFRTDSMISRSPGSSFQHCFITSQVSSGTFIRFSNRQPASTCSIVCSLEQQLSKSQTCLNTFQKHCDLLVGFCAVSLFTSLDEAFLFFLLVLWCTVYLDSAMSNEEEGRSAKLFRFNTFWLKY